MKKWICVLIIFLLGTLSLHADFLEAERKKAFNEKKLILLSVTKEFCPYCIKMEKDVFENTLYRHQIEKKYLHVTINRENPELPQALHVKYFPTNLILSPKDLKIIDDFAGYIEPVSFIELLDEVYEQEFK
jgi:thioredoxin-related protein